MNDENQGVVIDVPAANLFTDTTEQAPSEPPVITDTDGRIAVANLTEEQVVELFNEWAKESDEMEIQNLRGFIVRLRERYIHTYRSAIRSTAHIANAAVIAANKLGDNPSFNLRNEPVLETLDDLWPLRPEEKQG